MDPTQHAFLKTRGADEPLPVVINKDAGMFSRNASEAFRDRLAQTFERQGQPARIYQVPRDDLLPTLERLKQAGEPTIFVGGGDGTLNTAANVGVDTDIVFGMLPLGTVNHFAREINMPLKPEHAVQALLSGRVTAIDTGTVNGHTFLTQSSIGIYPHAVTKRRRYQKELGLSKWPAMGYALLGLFWRLPLLRFTMQVNHAQQVVKTPFVFVGNNRYQKESVFMIRRDSLQRGRLHIFYTQRIQSLALLKIFFQILFGRLQDAPELQSFESRELLLHSRKKHIKVAVDGEVLHVRPPLQFRSRPQSLNIIVPQTET